MVRVLIHTAGIILGLIFLVFGLNGFFLFVPVPEYHPFVSLLVSSGYTYFIKTVEVVGGALLLSNRFVPLALAMLGPDILNILAYHVLPDHRNWPVAIINSVLFLALLWGYRQYFRTLFVSRAEME